MSGEYYCIEEVVKPSNYHDVFISQSNKSTPGGLQNFFMNRDGDTHSNCSKKSQDLRLHEIEEQLQIAENRCNTLKGQLDSMKKIYKTSKNEPQQMGKRPETSFVRRHRHEHVSSSKSGKKRSSHFHVTSNASQPVTPMRKRPTYERYHESTDTIPQKSSSSSSAVPQERLVYKQLPTHNLQVPLFRQNSASIGTDNTGAAVRTINNILSGITNSVNRLSKIHNHEAEEKKFQTIHENDYGENGVAYENQFSPRLKKRIHDQQKNVERIYKHHKKETSGGDLEKLSNTSIRSKKSMMDKWARQINSKSSKYRNRPQNSLGNLNIPKQIPLTAKHVENTTKLRPIRTVIVEDETMTAIQGKKRKRGIKRLKQSSKISLGQKKSDGDVCSRERFTSDNLVELYHNVAAKGSESDNSGRVNFKSQTNRQKGGGDLPVSSVRLLPTHEVNPQEIINKTINKPLQPSPRALSPIQENLALEQIKADCFSNVTKNYELPTISSRMKQVTKYYLQSFNYRSIPFCAAKSTSPSHNIGINIQQVMSIIKTRQPITGISPTLAHNISLAAGRLQSSPLSAFVSNLSSRMGCCLSRHGTSSICPLIKAPLNYPRLQVMAKEIPEEPEEEAMVVDVDEDNVQTSEGPINHPSGELASQQTVWTVDASNQERCTCVSQKGVPFQQVLSKYQLSPKAIRPELPKVSVPKLQLGRRSTTWNGRKHRTASWVKNNVKNAYSNELNKTEPKDLQGKERNLKAVLKNLHDEFEVMNTKYEELSKDPSSNDPTANAEKVKELEEMEAGLNKKEEEINMVMSLYSEVLALKTQVKKLRERTSLDTIPNKIEKKEPNTVLHLTQLLRQIQNYQLHCKNKI